jgi:hypothetical protein
VAERVSEELLSIYTKSVEGSSEKLAPFLVVLKRLLLGIGSQAEILTWWDRLSDAVVVSMRHEKSVAKEALNSVLDLALSDTETTGSTDTGLNPYSDRLLKRWMRLYDDIHAGQDPTAGYKLKLLQDALMIYGKKDPKVRSRTACPPRIDLADTWTRAS